MPRNEISTFSMPEEDRQRQQENKALVGKYQLLTGWMIEGDNPIKADAAAFKLKNPDAAPFSLEVETSDMSVMSSYTERTRNYFRNGFHKTAATASYMGVSASASYAHQETHQASSTGKMLYITVYYDVQRVRLSFEPGDLDNEIEPTDDFLRAIRSALAAKDPYGELVDTVFKKYGQVFAKKVTLGGRLFIEDEERMTATTDEKTTSDDVQAKVSASFGSFSGSASHETKIETGTSSKDQSENKTYAVKRKGGDPAKLGEDWVLSLNNYERWTPIVLDGVVPIYDLLDDELRERVISVLRSGCKLRLRYFGMKSAVAKMKLSGCLTVPEGYQILSGGARVVTDGNGTFSERNLLRSSYPSVDKKSWIVEAQDTKPLPYVSDKLFPLCWIEIWVIALYDPDGEFKVQIRHERASSLLQNQRKSVSVDPGYYLTGGGAQIISTGATSFLTASFPDAGEDFRTWTVKSHDHLVVDKHDLDVYAIGVKRKDDLPLEVEYGFRDSTENQSHPIVGLRAGTGYRLIGGGAEINPGSPETINHHLVGSCPVSTGELGEPDTWEVASTEHFAIPSKSSMPACLRVYSITTKEAEFPAELPGSATAGAGTVLAA